MSSVKLTTTGGNGGTVELKGPANTTSNAAVQLTLPVDDGAANQYLKTDGSGVLSWATVAGGVDGISSSANATAITIDSSERVMIGTTTPGYTAGDDLTIQPPSGSGGITIRTGTSDSGKIYFADGTSGGDQYKGTITYSHANDTLALASPNGDALTVETDRNVTVEAGNLVIGTAGKGIDFSATGDATGSSSVSELFDDYEEGTWSPSCIQGTVTAARAKYTKIGNMVFLEGYFTSFSDTTTDSMFGWDNLPFTPAGVAGAYGNIIFTECDGIDLDAVEINCIVNSDPSIMVYGSTSAGSWKYVKHADLNAGAAMYMSCAYRVS